MMMDGGKKKEGEGVEVESRERLAARSSSDAGCTNLFN